MQEVVNATLLEKVETSIERNKSLQMLDIDFRHAIGAILKGTRGNNSLYNEVAHMLACFRGNFSS